MRNDAAYLRRQATESLRRYHERHRHDPEYMERMRVRSAKWREANAERNAAIKKKWYEAHKAEQRAKFRAAYAERTKNIPKRVLLTDAEKRRRKQDYGYRHRAANKESISAKHKAKWKDPEVRRKSNEARNRRFKEDPEFLLRHRLRTRMKHALDGELKAANTMALIGCSSAELRNRIEAQWTEGMDWSSYGSGDGKWQIDHIRPLVSFELSDPDQQRLAFHFSNLKPEWWKLNSEKSGKWNGVNYGTQRREKLRQLRQPSPCAVPSSA